MKIKRIMIFGVLAILAALALSTGCTLGAASHNWYASTTGLDTNDCHTAATPCRTINAAIGKAAAGDIVNIAAGTYAEHVQVNKNISLIGAAAATTIIDGGGTGTVLILNGSGLPSGVDLNVVVWQVTIRNGSGPSAGGVLVDARSNLTLLVVNIQGSTSDSLGAGLTNRGQANLSTVEISGNSGGTDCPAVDNSGTLVIDHGDIHGNLPPSAGSAVCNEAAGNLTLRSSNVHDNPGARGTGGRGISNDGTLTLTDTRITGHFVSGAGGGLVNEGHVTISGGNISGNNAASRGGGIDNLNELTMTNATVDGNTSAGDGGGIYSSAGVNITGGTISNNAAGATGNGGGIFDRGGLQLTGARIDHNQAAAGGGIYDTGGVILKGSTVTNNSALQGDGGGVSSLSQVTASNSTFDHNQANGKGGGIYVGCKGEITGSTLNDNQADAGGGLMAEFNSGCLIPDAFASDLQLRNDTVSGNTAPNGAGLDLVQGNRIDYLTAAFNHGAGIATAQSINPGSADFYIKNSIIADNDVDCIGAGLSSGGHNLASDGTCMLVGGGDMPHAAAHLLPLGSYGGPTQTHALGDASQAIDHGTCNLPSDQRGTARPQGGGCDIGAFEAVPGEVFPASTPATPALAQSLPYKIILTQNSNCRRGPGTAYESVDAYPAGQSLLVDGRNELAPLWWQVQLATNAKKHCWISSASGQPNGDPSLLPVVQVAPPPTETPKPGPIDFDKDGYPAGVDCNDNNAKVHPGAPETPKDGVDANCNGKDDK